MKTYKHLFETMLNPQTVAKCALDAAVGKLHRREVISAFRDFDATYDHVIACATNPDYHPCEDNTHKIIDGAHHKQREIEKPLFCPEQILHHMIVEPFKPVLINGLYEQAYGCLPPLVKTASDGKTKNVKKFGPMPLFANCGSGRKSAQKSMLRRRTCIMLMRRYIFRRLKKRCNEQSKTVNGCVLRFDFCITRRTRRRVKIFAG